MWDNPQMQYGNPYGQQPGWRQPMQNMQRQMGYGFGQPQQPQPPAVNLKWIRVSGPQGARDVSVQPGCEAWIMDENRPVFYYKAANEMGQSTIKAFRFEEISMDDTGSTPDVSQFVTREELQAISEKLNKLEKFASDLGGVNV